MSGARPCRYCGQDVVVRPMGGRARPVPFDKNLKPPDDVPEHLRYVPTQRGELVVMVAAGDVNPRRLLGVRWYATRHTCAQGLLACREARAAAEDDEVGSLADAVVAALLR